WRVWVRIWTLASSQATIFPSSQIFSTFWTLPISSLSVHFPKILIEGGLCHPLFRNDRRNEGLRSHVEGGVSRLHAFRPRALLKEEGSFVRRPLFNRNFAAVADRPIDGGEGRRHVKGHVVGLGGQA